VYVRTIVVRTRLVPEVVEPFGTTPMVPHQWYHGSFDNVILFVLLPNQMNGRTRIVVPLVQLVPVVWHHGPRPSPTARPRPSAPETAAAGHTIRSTIGGPIGTSGMAPWYITLEVPFIGPIGTSGMAPWYITVEVPFIGTVEVPHWYHTGTYTCTH
jgi:hypothetical protein